MVEFKIIDNFLSKSYHKEILHLMNGPNFPWYYQGNITYNLKNDSVYNFGFNHIFIDEKGPRSTNYYFLILPFVLKIHDVLNTNKTLRCRGDMTLQNDQGYSHPYHVDYEYPNIATIFYVNDSDGDSIFSDQKVSPKSNRLIIFDGYKMHTGTSPKNHKNRILINSNFVI